MDTNEGIKPGFLYGGTLWVYRETEPGRWTIYTDKFLDYPMIVSIPKYYLPPESTYTGQFYFKMALTNCLLTKWIYSDKVYENLTSDMNEVNVEIEMTIPPGFQSRSTPSYGLFSLLQKFPIFSHLVDLYKMMSW
jgi:hypothetical protein